MPKLPDDLGVRQTPNYQGQVVSRLNRGTTAPALAQAELGNTVSRIGAGIQDREDKLNYARAKSSLLQEQIKAVDELDQDPDFSTYETRYNERMKGARDASLKLLGNNRDRQAFELDSDADVQRGLQHVKTKARALETDSAIASVEQLTNDNREATIKAPDETTRIGLIKATQDSIDGLAARGYISRTKAVELRQRTAEDFASASIDALPYDQQIPLLSRKQPLFVAGKPQGLVSQGNLDLTQRPRVKNADGSISTVRSITVTDDKGQAVLLPTVIGNKVVSNKEAVEHYRSTGENLGVFKDQAAADKYGEALHEQQATMYAGGGSVADLIPSDKRQDMLERAQREKQAFEDHQRVLADRARAQYREDLVFRVQDAEAAYTAGQDFRDAPTKADFYRGFEPKQAERHWNSFKTLQNASADIRGLYNASPVERAAIIERSAPKSGDGFAEQQKIHNLLQQTNDRITAAQKADPAGYVLRTNPDIAERWSTLEETGDFQGYARSVATEQKRLGMPEVELLPKNVAQQLVVDLNNVEQGGEKSAGQIETLSQQWGDAWPAVYKQLSKDLQPSALIIGSGVDKPTAEILARTSSLKLDDLKTGLPAETTTDIKQQLSTQFAQAQQTFLQQAGGERTFNTIYDQAERLALFYTARGESPKDAVNRAYRSLLDDKYVLKDTYRVPRQYDADRIEEAAGNLLSPRAPAVDGFTVAKTGILPPAQPKGPTIDLSGIDVLPIPGVAPEFLRLRAESAVRRDGYWVTNKNETGLTLYTNGSAVTINGQPITVSFSELEAP
jgi:hypothetical protein